MFSLKKSFDINDINPLISPSYLSSVKAFAFFALVSTSIVALPSFADNPLLNDHDQTLGSISPVTVSPIASPKVDTADSWSSWLIDQGRKVAANTAEGIIDENSAKMGRRVARKVRQSIYKVPGVHVEDNDGNRIGVLVADNSQLIRGFFRSVLGVDLDSDLPGPNFMWRSILNLAENYARDLGEESLGQTIEKLAATGAQAMLRKAYGLAVDNSTNPLAAFDVRVDQDEVRTSLQTHIDEQFIEDEPQRVAFQQALDLDQDDGFVNKVAQYVRQIFTQFKQWIAQQVEDVITEVSNYYIGVVADSLHERGMKAAETTLTTITVSAAASFSGPAGMYLTSAAIAADHYNSDSKNVSYLRRFINWMTGADKKKQELKVAGQYRALSFAGSLMSRLGLVDRTDTTSAPNHSVVVEGLGDQNDFVFVDVEKPTLQMPSLKHVASGFAETAKGFIRKAAEVADNVMEAAEGLVDGFATDDVDVTPDEDAWARYIADSLYESPKPTPKPTTWFGGLLSRIS